MASFVAKVPIQSTAGAVPVKNEKGEITMEKVKVARYVTGKRPDYAPDDSSGEEEDLELGFLKKAAEEAQSLVPQEISEEAERTDRRLQRLKERHMEDEEEEEDIEERRARHRRLHEPEVLDRSSDEEEEKPMEMEESSGEEEELDEEEIERRRIFLREKAKQISAKEEELMDKEEEKSEEGSEEESSEYEEYSDSEEEETGPRLKPVFVRKKDRITIQEKRKKYQKTALMEREMKRVAEERRRQTLRLVEEEARKEHESLQKELDPCDAVDTDDDNDEEEYEMWKVRELKRLKRDREERETIEKEKLEIERLRNMTEEERRQELKSNPKTVTNKAVKGRYKFLQKYYHRGAFFMDEEESVYKRDFSAATLEDHFNKTILPKVMQVKNFGRSGRTKYTHLVDQDTTQTDSPWADPLIGGRLTAKASTSKEGFEKPSVKKRK